MSNHLEFIFCVLVKSCSFVKQGNTRSVLFFTMATGSNVKKSCCKCSKGGGTLTCDGCHQSFCFKHVTEHRQELSQHMDDIGQQHDVLRRDLGQQNINQTLLTEIDRWEKESIEKIQSTAERVRADLKRLNEESTNRLSDMMDKLSEELRLNRESDEYIEDDLDRWMKQLDEFRKALENPAEIELSEDTSAFLHLIKISNPDGRKQNKPNSISTNICHPEEKQGGEILSGTPSQDDHPTTYKSELLPIMNESSYPSVIFGIDQSKNPNMRTLFINLMSLAAMDKKGPMNGNCVPQTHQMEQFLTKTFDFKNRSRHYIVPGVKSFQLGRTARDMDPNTLIHFPDNITGSFDMTASEIIEWQSSYAVYTDKNIKQIDEQFLHRALQGGSRDGEEAFRMKFVVRVSTCPILMEFDAKIIPRRSNEGWPTRIKLVSVTGIDFAGRKHDEDDIRHYVSNWRDIYEVDRTTDRVVLYNNRDLHRKKDSPPGKLHEDRLLRDLINMARLRLRACDEEGVQIVVETGIGLGVFSGEAIGIDEKVRLTSALAIRTVLEQDGKLYKNISAIVFALPIFNKTRSNEHIPDVFDAFVEQFQEPQYNGTIPVMIADQDMHRLTVAIARYGFIVSELNPADSHGVFGEYWQNHGPAVEEKIALTTVGLLVQHHLINPHVLNSNNHHFI
jgi:archaellum component FlaC